ncbi:MAG: histidine kinase N-terminal 7TM domain-containing protein [Anaerolineales bacterium]
MNWEYNLALILLVVAAGIATLLALFTRRRPAPGARKFALLMLMLDGWYVGLALQIAGGSLLIKYLGLRIEYTVTFFIGVLWLAFVLSYTGSSDWLTRPRAAALCAIPALSTLLLWTNGQHHLLLQDVHLPSPAPFVPLEWTPGPLLWIGQLYVYLLMASGAVLLGRQILRLPQIYVGQIAALLVGLAVLVVTSLLYLFEIVPSHVPLGAYALLAAALSTAFGLFRWQLLDLVPVARDVVVDELADGVLVLDRQRRLVDVNLAAERWLGSPADEVVGKDLARVAPLLAEGLFPLLTVEAGADPFLQEVQREGRVYTLRVSPLYGRDGQPTGWVLVLHDVTDLRTALLQAEAAAEAQSRFVSNVSHELRTPLTNITLYLALLERGKPERHAFYMDTLHRETERLKFLIEGLLRLSRLDLQEVTPQPCLLDVNVLVETLAQDRRPLFAEHELELGTQLEPALPAVSADPQLLEQVLTNLLSNALNYTPAGGHVWVQTDESAEEGTHWVTISVRDTGVGISAEEQARLFTRFYRGAASRNPETAAPGTGLGLAISQEIMALHAGRITVESEGGEGSTFTLWLPADANGAPDTLRNT